MDKQELIEILKKSDDKLSILGNEENLIKYRLTSNDLYQLIEEFLTDEEKVSLLEIPFYLKLNSSEKSIIISLITDENLILKVINNKTIIYNISCFDVPTIISNLSEKNKEKVLLDKELIKENFNMDDFEIVPLIKELSSDEIKDKFIEIYKLNISDETEVLKSCSDDHKIEMLLKKEYFRENDVTELLSTLSCEKLVEFIKEHKDIIQKKEVKLFEVISQFDKKQQELFIENLEDLNLSLIEKREIIAILKDEVKEKIDTTDFSNEYKIVLSMKAKGKSIILNFDRNLEDYRGLDRLIIETPESYSKEKIDKFMELCDICPDMTIFNTFNPLIDDSTDEKDEKVNQWASYSSTAKEYKEAEQWISSLIESINPEYSPLQKIAIIDHAIGKKVSYSPDFDTEFFNIFDSRSIWKIISSGYGVCNGISKLEQYILSRVGIESELVISSSGSHAFLKIIDIELPLENGETVIGNTILDSTWNLSANRFDGKPNNFCLSYEEIRKRDIE